MLDTGDVTPLLTGRTVIQLSTGTPLEAREIAEWFASHHVAGVRPAGVSGRHVM